MLCIRLWKHYKSMTHTAVLNDHETTRKTNAAYFTECPLAMPLDRVLGSLTGANDLCDMHMPFERELSGTASASAPNLLGVYKAVEFIP